MTCTFHEPSKFSLDQNYLKQKFNPILPRLYSVDRYNTIHQSYDAKSIHELDTSTGILTTGAPQHQYKVKDNHWSIIPALHFSSFDLFDIDLHCTYAHTCRDFSSKYSNYPSR